jgi:hypothetical protein
VRKKETDFEKRKQEVIRLSANIDKWKLDTSDSFKLATIDQRTSAYNGAGPDTWPWWALAILTFLLRRFREAVLIHDWDFSQSDGSLTGWLIVNYRFWCNMVKIIEVKYGKWYARPLFRYWNGKATGSYLGVMSDKCWKQWQECGGRRFPEENNNKIEMQHGHALTDMD